MPEGRAEIAFAGTLEGFEKGFARLRDELDRCALAPADRYGAELVFEEIVANIVRYGAPGGSPARVQVLIELSPDSIALVFEDDGVAYDPRSRTDPAPAHSLRDASVGGRGIMIVRRLARSIDYVRTGGHHNRLTVRLPRSLAVIDDSSAARSDLS